MRTALDDAHRACEVLTKRAGANFSVGFRFLPPAKRRGVFAAYAFCRLADDLADEPGNEDPQVLLARCEAELEAAYERRPSHPIGLALADVLQRYPIPKAAFAGLIDGCRDDLVKHRYADFAELNIYVGKVAWTISDISLAIFGPLPGQETEALALGRALASALQLTNICRDVGDDVARQRIYLPLDELHRFGVGVDDILARRATPAFLRLMEFQCARAAAEFERARPLPECLEADARLAVRLMAAVYEAVLEKVRAEPARVFERRAALSIGEKLALVARASGRHARAVAARG